jgi:hypothetical protein
VNQPGPSYPQGYPPPGGYPAPPAPVQPKKGRGCLIAIAILGGFFVLGGLGVGFFVWRVANSEEGRKIVSAVSSGAQMVQEATNAPGTAELRALGCQTAAVLDAEKLAQFAAQFGDAGHVDMEGARLAVTCQVKRGAGAPTCDQAAATYVRAIGGHAAGVFDMSVQVANEHGASCEGRYDASGAPLAHH